MKTVYAITDDNDRFVMFQTSKTDFAYSNAKATAHLYLQNVVAYEFDGQKFKIED